MVDSHLTEKYDKVQDDLYVTPSSEGIVYMYSPVQRTVRIPRISNLETTIWMKTLPSSAINAFDVFRPTYQDLSALSPSSLVLIRQPLIPFFRSIIPEFNPVATFLNTTEQGT